MFFLKACRFLFFQFVPDIMWTFNISFFVEPAGEERLLSYIRSSLLPVLINESSAICNPALKKVVETGGDYNPEETGVSIALSVDFLSKEEAYEWHGNVLLPALKDFNTEADSNALFLITFLERLEL